jgi:cell division protein FtsB
MTSVLVLFLVFTFITLGVTMAIQDSVATLTANVQALTDEVVAVAAAVAALKANQVDQATVDAVDAAAAGVAKASADLAAAIA